MEVASSALDGGEEVEEFCGVVAFWESFAVEYSFLLKCGVWVEESVGGDEGDVWCGVVHGEEFVQDSGGGAFSDSDASGDPDDVGDMLDFTVKELAVLSV